MSKPKIPVSSALGRQQRGSASSGRAGCSLADDMTDAALEARRYPACRATVTMKNPTSKAKPKSDRSRRRPDPHASVTEDLQAWFDADPSQAARELLARLKQSDPDYPDALLRTLQRRLKAWRAEIAHTLVFGRAERTDTAKPAPKERGFHPQDALELSNQSGCTEHGCVLATVKVCLSTAEYASKVGVAANLNGVCARRQRGGPMPGRGCGVALAGWVRVSKLQR